MHYLLFLPGKRAANPQNLHDVGLGALLRPDDAAPMYADLLGAGPGGEAGQMVTWAPASPVYQPDRQVWRRAAPDPVRNLPGGRYWVGWWAGDPPTPEELARPKVIFGPARLRYNGFDWQVPESAGYLVEWWDEEAEDATSYLVDDDPGWTKCRWRYSVLEKECGIYFEGSTPPGELWLLLQEDKLHLRITAAIDTDLALEREAVRRSASPSGRDQTLFLDLSRKFFDRQLADSSVLSGDDERGEPDERDDATQLTEFLEQLRDENDAATVSVSVQLDGVDHSEYQIGQLIESVVGRNLTFNANNPDNGNPRRMQIVGFNWRFAGGQKTELMLEDFRLERGALIQQWGL